MTDIRKRLPEAEDDKLFESAPGLYAVLRPDLIVVAVTDTFLQTTMTTRENVIGRHFWEIFPANPNDPGTTAMPDLAASIERVVRSKTPDTIPLQRYDIRKPETEGGSYEVRYWSPTTSPVFDDNGNVKFVTLRVEDVTEYIKLKESVSEQQGLNKEFHDKVARMESETLQHSKQMADASRQLKDANAELATLYERTRELDKLKSQFFANVSHELRTPLALILGQVETLLGSEAVLEEQRRPMESIARNARILLKQVNDLLDASKIEAGKMTVNYTDVDVSDLVRLIAGQFDSLAVERQIDYQVEADEPIAAQVDPEKLQCILINLVSNAFKFTPQGGKIRCSLRYSRDKATLEVADSGPGIAPEHREVIFERFRQLDGSNTRHFGGTGLGLAIARDFVALHKGAISISDAPEGGALFIVDIPVQAPEGSKMQQSSTKSVLLGVTRAGLTLEELRGSNIEAPKSRSLADLDKPLVLVVEDNHEMNRFILDVLAKHYRVIPAFNGREGLDKTLSARPDLIITDMMMPEMSGEDLIRSLRQRRDFSAIPIIMLTAKADELGRIELLRIGANDYLTKPFSVEELRARVKNLIDAKLSAERFQRASWAEGQARLNEISAQLQQIGTGRTDASLSIAQGLRAPLRSIDGLTLAILEDFGESLDRSARDYLHRVRTAAQYMSRVIDGIANAAQTEEPNSTTG